MTTDVALNQCAYCSGLAADFWTGHRCEACAKLAGIDTVAVLPELEFRAPSEVYTTSRIFEAAARRVYDRAFAKASTPV